MTAPTNLNLPLPAGATSAVVNSIRQAARATNVDFGLLMAQAQQESGFRSDAKAVGSSAAGLYQFIDSTWLAMVQRFGAKYGAGNAAQQITLDPSGHATVADPVARRRILDMRNDPQLSASLAAEYAKVNKDALEQALGRPPGNTDLYIAHFLGATGATNFLRALQTSGGTVAADLLPEAASANHDVFYDATGRGRTVGEIYQTFSQQIDTSARRFAGVSPLIPPSSPSQSLDGAAFLRSLGFTGREITPPLAAMLNVFAASALKLLDGGGPKGPYTL